MTRDVPARLLTAGRDFPWEQLHVVVAGIGISGSAAARALAGLGANVHVVDDRAGEEQQQRAEALRGLGARVRLGPDTGADVLDRAQLVVTSPGWRPDTPLLRQAAARGIPVWGEVELAWWLRDRRRPAPWLCVTGTNGKTTTVRMLEAMLLAAGKRAAAAGNVGTPLVEAVLTSPPLDVLAVELSSFQLHWTSSPAAQAAAILNLAEDHTDWHGSQRSYAQAKARVFTGAQVAAVYNAEDAATRRLAEQAEVGPGCQRVGFTLAEPRAGMLGVRDGALTDRAFAAGAELAAVTDVRPGAPHNVANALAAAALARAHGVEPAAVRQGLRRFRPEGHRISDVAVVGGVRYVDDSKATNPHAAAASIGAYDRVVWVAGGLAKGVGFDDLVCSARSRLRGVVLLGADRSVIAAALARHAPDVRVIEVPGTDTGVMHRAVRAAAGLACPGDTVLLAPGCASQDIFRDYAARGDAFADAVSRLAAAST